MLQWVAGQIRERSSLKGLTLRLMPDFRFRHHVREVGPMSLRFRRHRALWLRPPFHRESFVRNAFDKLGCDGAIYDIGANIGLYCLYVLSQFPNARVVAFEPMPDNLVDLRHNLSLRPKADAERVTIIEAAVADVDGTESFQLDDIMGQSASLDRVKHGQAATGRASARLEALVAPVRVVRLDSLLAERPDLPPPALMKIDVEGAEALVLDGARETIERHRPDLIIELHDAELARNVSRTLLDLGYQCIGSFADVDRRVDRPVTPEALQRVTHKFDLEHVAASHNATRLAW